MTNNLSNVKVGDTIWIKQTVQSIDSDLKSRPIETEWYYLSIDGKEDIKNQPIAFIGEPFEARESKERVVLVSDDGENWQRRVLIKEVDGWFLCWNKAKTIEDSKKSIHTYRWSYMKELPKLTIEELAEKAGLTVEEVKAITNQ